MSTVCSFPPEYCEFSSKSSKYASDPSLGSFAISLTHPLSPSLTDASNGYKILTLPSTQSTTPIVRLTLPNSLANSINPSPLSFLAALEDKLANLTVEQKAALEKDLAKKEKKEEIKAEKEKAKIAVSLPLPSSSSPPILKFVWEFHSRVRSLSSEWSVTRRSTSLRFTASITSESTSRKLQSCLRTSLERVLLCQRRRMGMKKS